MFFFPSFTFSGLFLIFFEANCRIDDISYITIWWKGDNVYRPCATIRCQREPFFKDLKMFGPQLTSDNLWNFVVSGIPVHFSVRTRSFCLPAAMPTKVTVLGPARYGSDSGYLYIDCHFYTFSPFAGVTESMGRCEKIKAFN